MYKKREKKSERENIKKREKKYIIKMYLIVPLLNRKDDKVNNLKNAEKKKQEFYLNSETHISVRTA